MSGHDPRSRGRAPAGEPLRILIADDNPVIRMGLRMLLEAEPDLCVVAEAADGEQALVLAVEHAPDIVLLDVRMPGRGGLDVLPELVALAGVLMLTSSEEDETIRAALTAGARGYLVYGTVDEAAIVQSIRTAAGGGSVFSAGVAEALLTSVAVSGPAVSGPDPAVRPEPGSVVGSEPGSVAGSVARASAEASHRPRTVEAPGGILSEREVAVMELLAAGRSNAEIAERLFLAPKTVKNHINRIFAKLLVTNRAQAMAFWLGSADDGSGRYAQGPGRYAQAGPWRG